MTEIKLTDKCSYCGKAGHWRPDCPEIAELMETRIETPVRVEKLNDLTEYYDVVDAKNEFVARDITKQKAVELVRLINGVHGLLAAQQAAMRDMDKYPPDSSLTSEFMSGERFGRMCAIDLTKALLNGK